jgi:hypothetical protein
MEGSMAELIKYPPTVPEVGGLNPGLYQQVFVYLL